MICIVPSRGLTGMLSACLHALEVALSNTAVARHSKIIVLDNASPFPLLASEVGPHTDLWRFDTHQSFSALVNFSAQKFPDRDLLLLNNDVILNPLALSQMEQLGKQQRVAVVGTRLVYPEGTIQHAGVYQAQDGPQHVARGRPSSAVPRKTTFPTAVTAAVMLIKRPAFDMAGGFDTRYDFGSEDIDFCHRVSELGFRIACNQGSDSLHFESMTPGRSERDVPSRQAYLNKWSERVTREW